MYNLAMTRIDSIDALRGFSLLGILLLNIVSFGLPFAAYMNPSVAGGVEGLNLATWLTAMTLWDGKMRCIFSMLFGASAWLLVSRAEQRGDGIQAADVYYRRTMWLIVIGLLHAHLIWAGDILYGYGVIGLLLFPLRNLKPKTLIITGLVLIALHSLQGIGVLRHWRNGAEGESRRTKSCALRRREEGHHRIRHAAGDVWPECRGSEKGNRDPPRRLGGQPGAALG